MWRRVNYTYHKQLFTNPSGDCKNLTRMYCSAPRDSSSVLSIMQLAFLILIPKNEIST